MSKKFEYGFSSFHVTHLIVDAAIKEDTYDTRGRFVSHAYLVFPSISSVSREDNHGVTMYNIII